MTQITQRRLTVTSLLLDKIELGLSFSLSLYSSPGGNSAEFHDGFKPKRREAYVS